MYFEEVLLGAIDRVLAVDGRGAPKGGDLLQTGTDLERQVGHEVNISDILLIHPVAQLLSRKLRKALLQAEGLQLFQCLSKKRHFGVGCKV